MTTSFRTTGPSRLLVTGLLLASLVGCAEFRAPTSWIGLPGSIPRATARNPASRIVAIWQPADGRNLNGLPGRGFAGQILFFPAKGEAPIAVDGDVRIYVFDDQGSPEEQMKPMHQFDFAGGSWEAQLVEGSLGPAYQVFIPYTRKGTHRAKCSLRIRLQPEVGTALYSEVIDVVLPGPDSPAAPEPIVSTPRPTTRTPTTSIQLTRAERPAPVPTPGKVSLDPAAAPHARKGETLLARFTAEQAMPREQATAEPSRPVERPEARPEPATQPEPTPVHPLSAASPPSRHEPPRVQPQRFQPRAVPQQAVPQRPEPQRFHVRTSQVDHGTPSTVAPPTRESSKPRRRYRLTPAASPSNEPVETRTLSPVRSDTTSSRRTVDVHDSSSPFDPQPTTSAWPNPVSEDVWQRID